MKLEIIWFVDKWFARSGSDPLLVQVCIWTRDVNNCKYVLLSYCSRKNLVWMINYGIPYYSVHIYIYKDIHIYLYLCTYRYIYKYIYILEAFFRNGTGPLWWSPQVFFRSAERWSNKRRFVSVLFLADPHQSSTFW